MSREEQIERDLADLSERVIRLEERVAEITKKLDAHSNYFRQLYDYLARLRE
jgi:DNA mismatch repair ATPase MutS